MQIQTDSCCGLISNGRLSDFTTLRINAKLHVALSLKWLDATAGRVDEIRLTPSGPSLAENRASQSRLASGSLRLCIVQGFLASFSLAEP